MTEKNAVFKKRCELQTDLLTYLLADEVIYREAPLLKTQPKNGKIYYGQWSLVNHGDGQWSLVNWRWSMVIGQLAMVNGHVPLWAKFFTLPLHLYIF